MDEPKIRKLAGILLMHCHDSDAQVCTAAYQALSVAYRQASHTVQRFICDGVLADLESPVRGWFSLRHLRYICCELEEHELSTLIARTLHWLRFESAADVAMQQQLKSALETLLPLTPHGILPHAIVELCTLAQTGTLDPCSLQDLLLLIPREG